ncbi:MAG TPA: Fe-S cluster protein, partial [Bacillota bacterium]|nr:Fe-S cluster protein [Bacillota bacterium]
GNPYDFVLTPLPGEISARKIVLPFRSDLVEKLELKKGDLVMGRPMGAGCPIPHILKIIEAEYNTGLLYTWVVGPKFSREQEVKDLTAYHMVGFEGVASEIRKEPGFGRRVTFLPGFCMMNLNHTGLVNMILTKSFGLHVRIEDIRILAG